MTKLKYSYQLFQLKDIRKSNYGFMSWGFAKDHGFNIDDYKFVYGMGSSTAPELDGLFEKFNLHRPYDFKGHSMSVSDVVAIREDDNWRWYYCDSFGWEDITELVDSQKERYKLCGFVFCHGNKDFSCWEVDLPDHAIEEIQAILDRYSSYGTSERNVWDSKFSDVLAEEY